MRTRIPSGTPRMFSSTAAIIVSRPSWRPFSRWTRHTQKPTPTRASALRTGRPARGPGGACATTAASPARAALPRRRGRRGRRRGRRNLRRTYRGDPTRRPSRRASRPLRSAAPVRSRSGPLRSGPLCSESGAGRGHPPDPATAPRQGPRKRMRRERVLQTRRRSTRRRRGWRGGGGGPGARAAPRPTAHPGPDGRGRACPSARPSAQRGSSGARRSAGTRRARSCPP